MLIRLRRVANLFEVPFIRVCPSECALVVGRYANAAPGVSSHLKVDYATADTFVFLGHTSVLIKYRANTGGLVDTQQFGDQSMANLHR